MVDGDWLREWGPRLVAPIAFFVAATVLILLVQNALSSGEASPTTTTTPTQTAPTTTDDELDTTGQTETDQRRRRRFYRIKPGDLLESIAARFDTTVERLVELNPEIDPQALTVGERIRLR
jgi:spore germination protein YaaH